MIDPEQRIQRQLERQARMASGGANTTQPVAPPGGGAPPSVGGATPPPATPPLQPNAQGVYPVTPPDNLYGDGVSHVGGANTRRGLNPKANDPGDPNPVVPPETTGATSPTDTGNGLEWRKTLSYGNGPGQLNGFNTTGEGYDDKAANSVKNTFGRIASRYPATPEGLTQLVNDPDFKRAFPNAKLVPGGAGDKIDFGGVLSDFESGVPVGVVDVGQSFDPSNNSGNGWWWGHDAGGSGGAGGGAGAGAGSAGAGGQRASTGTGYTAPGGAPDLSSILSGTDPMNDIIKRIEALQSGQTPEAEKAALLKMLRGEV